MTRSSKRAGTKSRHPSIKGKSPNSIWYKVPVKVGRKNCSK